MRLNEAIRIKETYLRGDEAVDHDEHLEADRLSIEALKREQLLRREVPYDRNGLLPGETEE